MVEAGGIEIGQKNSISTRRLESLAILPPALPLSLERAGVRFP